MTVLLSLPPTMAVGDVGDDLVAAINGSDDLARRGRRQWIGRRYGHLLEPHFAACSVWALDPMESATALEAEHREHLHALLLRARMMQNSQFNVGCFVTLTRHLQCSAIGRTLVGPVRDAIKRAARDADLGDVLISSIRPDHVHVILGCSRRIAPDHLARSLASQSSRVLDVAAPWMMRYVNGVRISQWDRDPHGKACAVMGNGWRGIEGYLCSQGRHHYDGRKGTSGHRTQRTFYGEGVERTPNSFFARQYLDAHPAQDRQARQILAWLELSPRLRDVHCVAKLVGWLGASRTLGYLRWAIACWDDLRGRFKVIRSTRPTITVLFAWRSKFHPVYVNEVEC